MHFRPRNTALLRPGSLAFLLTLLLLSTAGRAQEVARRKWPEISPFKNILLRAADTLSAVEKDGRPLRLLKTGTRKVIPESGDGFEIMEWALEDSGRIEPVNSLVWLRQQDDTVTMVVGHGPDRTTLGFTELRVDTAGLKAVYLENGDPSARAAVGFRKAASTGIAIACVLTGGVAGGVIGSQMAEGEGSGNPVPGKEQLGYAIGGGLVGAAIGTFAAIFILQAE